MYRPQLERYLRAVFFSSTELATDAQVHAFREKDEMPKISFTRLAESAMRQQSSSQVVQGRH